MKPHPTPLLLGEGNTKCGRGFLTRFFVILSDSEESRKTWSKWILRRHFIPPLNDRLTCSKSPCLRHPPLSRGNSFVFLAPLDKEGLGRFGWHFHLTFSSNILQLNCYDIFIFYTVYRNVIVDIRITTILSTYMN